MNPRTITPGRLLARAILFATCVFVIPCLHARAQSPQSIDYSFNPGSGIDGASSTAYCLSVLTNGQIVVGGYFSQYNGVSFNNIARLNRDGCPDTDFFVGQGPSGTVYALAPQTNGMMLVGGNFSVVNGIIRGGLVRLRFDGSLDIGFNPNVASSALALAVRPNGQIVVGGGFPQIAGRSIVALAQLNADGTLDSSFIAGLAGGSSVTSLALDSSGNVYAAGNLFIVTNQYSLARFKSDGSIDPAFAFGPLNGSVSTVMIAPNGQIVVSGTFSEINGYSRYNIARLNSDGSVDPNFHPSPQFYATLLSIQPNGKIFAMMNSALTLLNVDGTTDSTFNPVIAIPYAVATQPDGKILVAGHFNQVDGANAINSIVRLQGESLTPLQTQLLNFNFYPGVQLSGSIGATYRVESTTNLASAALWTPLATFVLSNTPYLFIDTNSLSLGGNRFYRSVVIP